MISGPGGGVGISGCGVGDGSSGGGAGGKSGVPGWRGMGVCTSLSWQDAETDPRQGPFLRHSGRALSIAGVSDHATFLIDRP
jgi:hypothetical protein